LRAGGRGLVVIRKLIAVLEQGSSRKLQPSSS